MLLLYYKEQRVTVKQIQYHFDTNMREEKTIRYIVAQIISLIIHIYAFSFAIVTTILEGYEELSLFKFMMGRRIYKIKGEAKNTPWLCLSWLDGKEICALIATYTPIACRKISIFRRKIRGQ